MSEFVRRVTQLAQPIASRLGQLDVELTERCNNDCIHCCINLPADDASARQREMTTGQVAEILKQAADLGCLQVRFTGGEPLLRSDFEDLYLLARRLGMKVLLFTNARLITPRLANLFARIPPLVPIEVSVYGMHVASYEAVTRAPGSFAQFRRGVNLLLERNVPFIVKAALLPHNKHEMDEFESWARAFPSITEPPSCAMFFELRSRRDDPAKNRLIESLRVSPKEGLPYYLRNEARYAQWTPNLAEKLLMPPGAGLFHCGACEGHSACVDAYGRAQVCLGLRAPGLSVDIVSASGPGGSLLLAALDQFKHLRELPATNREYLERCARCFIKAICEQCPAKSWTETGTLDAPVEYLCQLTHAFARHLGWLDEGEYSWEIVDGWKRVQRSFIGDGLQSPARSSVKQLPRAPEEPTQQTGRKA